MHQVGYHSTPNHLMQQFIASDIKSLKHQGRVMHSGLAFALRELGFLDMVRSTRENQVTRISRWINQLPVFVGVHDRSIVHYTK